MPATTKPSEIDRDSRGRVGLASLRPYLRGHRTSLIAVGALSLLGTALALSQPVLVRSVLDRLAERTEVSTPVALLVAVLVGAAVLTGFRDFILQRTAERLVLSTRKRLAGHLLRLPVAEYDRRRTGDLLSRLGADTTLLRTVITSGVFDLVTGAITVVGATAAMVLIDGWLFGVTVVGLAIALTVGLLTARPLRALSRATQARLGEMTSAVERALAAVRTIRASRAEGREAEIIGRHAHDAYRAGVRLAARQALVGPISSTAMQAVLLLVLGVGGSRVAGGHLSVGSLVAFVLFMFYVFMPLGQAIRAYVQLQSGLAALERIEEVLRTPPENPSGLPKPRVADSMGVTRRNGSDRGAAVEFDRVVFGYDGTPVLREVSFSVPFGSRTAVVGPSAAGKSTLLMLVERFYDVQSGSVRVAGRDVRHKPLADLRGQLGYVEQEAPVLAGTLRDNLTLVAPEATEDQLLRVLAEVRLEHVLARTPKGLDTEVGERGVLLSGGERQRLAIARCLLADQPILLMDEPTSNLDARNEARLRELIDRATVDRTTIIVAHRLSTVVDADQIVVLDRGEVVDVGSHRELTGRNDLYRELARHQLMLS
ncbi:ABC transporter ATP-binding protein [Micromonospora parva]|uniref:ABC transporter ATP-binding protein n=1 Tax=Micromonospora parva TaxID=1464048 RepID=UPI0033FCE367